MSENTKKIKKTPGPIRFEAVIPITIIVVGVMIYFKFFFDANMRKAIEWTGTYVHGAQVDLGSFRTSILGGSLEMRDLQITDKNQPQRNLFHVGRIGFQMSWDALLRAKFVIDEAAITDIRALTQRSKPGWVKPPTPPDGKPSAIEKVQGEVINKVQSDYNDNLLGDVASLVGGTDYKDQLKTIEGELKASGRIKELETELKAKQAVWQERIKALPQSKEIEAIGQKVKMLKFDTKNPVQFAKSLKDAEALIKEVDQKVRLVKDTTSELKGDVDTYSKSLKELEGMVNEDIKDLQSRLKIPSLNPADFSKQLFGKMLQQNLADVRKYAEVAKEYLPPKKSKEERKADRLVPPPRGEGQNFKFPVTKGYPLFWLKSAKISSELDQSENAGRLSGELRDLTSDPPYLGRPTVLDLEGDFPKQNIMGFVGKVTLDHTTDVAKQTVQLIVGSFPLERKVLTDSADVQIAMTEARGQSELNAKLQDERFTVNIRNQFGDVKYDIGAKEKLVQEILTNVITAIPNVTLDADITGSWSDFSLRVRSNLGDELSRGFQKQIQAKIDEAKAQLKGLIDSKIKGEKEKLSAEFEKIKSQVTGQLNSKQAEIDKAKTSAEGEVKGAKSSASPAGAPAKKLEEEGKKAVDDLKKKFGL